MEVIAGASRSPQVEIPPPVRSARDGQHAAPAARRRRHERQLFPRDSIDCALQEHARARAPLQEDGCGRERRKLFPQTGVHRFVVLEPRHGMCTPGPGERRQDLAGA